MRRTISCLRCHTPMRFQGEEQIQLGKTGWILGDLPNLFAGAMDVEIFQCPKCGKLEFFGTEETEYRGGQEGSRKTCPECGAEHDRDCACCPICGHVYCE